MMAEGEDRSHINKVWEACLTAKFPHLEEAVAKVEEDFKILASKGQGYGPSWKIGGLILPATCLLIKAVRIYNIAGKMQFGAYSPKHESLVDSLKDLQNYLHFANTLAVIAEEAYEAQDES